MTLRPGWFCFCVGWVVWTPAAWAYPHLALRPADTVLAGPADGHLASMFYNPASIRLRPGSEVLLQGGAHVYLGHYERQAEPPTGFGTGLQTNRAPILWANPQTLAAASWDLRSDSVTLALAFSTPAFDRTDYQRDGLTAEQLSTRYHAIRETSYSLWGSLAVGIKLKSWLLLGGSFHIGYSRSNHLFFRDRDAQGRDALGCGGACEQWVNHVAIETDVDKVGYGFSVGGLIEPVHERLWLGLSYGSPLLSDQGAVVALEGQPTDPLWKPGESCPPGWMGARFQAYGEQTSRCGAARVTVAFPHLIYFGARARFPRGESATALRSIELASWVRLSVAGRFDQEIQFERALTQVEVSQTGTRPIQPLLQNRPLSSALAFAITWGVRQHFRRVTVGEEILYETPRGEVGVVSPANLDGHKLDFSVSVRARLHRKLSLHVSGGGTYLIFPEQSGGQFDTGLAQSCRQQNYDVTHPNCVAVSRGLAVSPALGQYAVSVAHGSVGLEFHL